MRGLARMGGAVRKKSTGGNWGSMRGLSPTRANRSAWNKFKAGTGWVVGRTPSTAQIANFGELLTGYKTVVALYPIRPGETVYITNLTNTQEMCIGLVQDTWAVDGPNHVGNGPVPSAGLYQDSRYYDGSGNPGGAFPYGPGDTVGIRYNDAAYTISFNYNGSAWFTFAIATPRLNTKPFYPAVNGGFRSAADIIMRRVG